VGIPVAYLLGCHALVIVPLLPGPVVRLWRQLSSPGRPRSLLLLLELSLLLLELLVMLVVELVLPLLLLGLCVLVLMLLRLLLLGVRLHGALRRTLCLLWVLLLPILLLVLNLPFLLLLLRAGTAAAAAADTGAGDAGVAAVRGCCGWWRVGCGVCGATRPLGGWPGALAAYPWYAGGRGGRLQAGAGAGLAASAWRADAWCAPGTPEQKHRAWGALGGQNTFPLR